MRTCRSRSNRFKPGLEQLEDRRTPATTVTTFADVVNLVDGVTSLREAIALVNAGLVADNTVNLPAGLFKITIPGAGEDNNATGDFDVKHTLILRGTGASSSVIDGNQLDRVFDVATSVSATFAGVTIQNGQLTGNGGGINGGADAATAITLLNGVVTGNQASFDGGGIFCQGGTITITASQITNNYAGLGGGVVLGSAGSALTISGSTIRGNRSGGTVGGLAIIGWFAGKLTLTGSAVSDNFSLLNNGGGGGIFLNTTAQSLIQNTILSNNIARNGGGIDIVGSGRVSVSDSTITGNHAVLGGGILQENSGSVDVSNTLVRGNFSDTDGGGIAALGAGLVTIAGSVIDRNQAGRGGGGVFVCGGASVS